VLDGYPKTLAEAKALWTPDPETSEEEKGAVFTLIIFFLFPFLLHVECIVHDILFAFPAAAEEKRLADREAEKEKEENEEDGQAQRHRKQTNGN